ncbi:MAG: hypothetical protein ACKVVT_15920 [Dehalococcoidia bacterium]
MTTPPTSPPEPEGIAGYVTPYPYLDKLQEKMEERLARRVPVKGRFCGFCYGRLQKDAERCPYCGNPVAASGTVEEIPQDVLRAFQARQRTEARWVHLGAFTGLILAAGLFLWMVLWAPGFLGHPALAFIVLILGGYVLAQLFGPLLGGQLGYRKGSRKRDALWAAWLARREG